MILYIYNGLKNEFYFSKRDEKRNLRIVKRMSPDKNSKIHSRTTVSEQY